MPRFSVLYTLLQWPLQQDCAAMLTAGCLLLPKRWCPEEEALSPISLHNRTHSSASIQNMIRSCTLREHVKGFLLPQNQARQTACTLPSCDRPPEFGKDCWQAAQLHCWVLLGLLHWVQHLFQPASHKQGASLHHLIHASLHHIHHKSFNRLHC